MASDWPRQMDAAEGTRSAMRRPPGTFVDPRERDRDRDGPIVAHRANRHAGRAQLVNETC